MKTNMKKYLYTIAVTFLSFCFISCSGDDSENTEPLEETTLEELAAENEAEMAEESSVSFSYTGDYEGTVNTSDITAQNLDGGDIDLAIDLAESGMMYVNLQESDFQVGEMMDIYQEDRNTLTLELGDYKLLLQPGSQLTVADRSDNGIHIKSGEMTFKGYQISDDMQERPSKMITLKDLDLQYYR
jgi:hypothetical protein